MEGLKQNKYINKNQNITTGDGYLRCFLVTVLQLFLCTYGVYYKKYRDSVAYTTHYIILFSLTLGIRKCILYYVCSSRPPQCAKIFNLAGALSPLLPPQRTRAKSMR